MTVGRTIVWVTALLALLVSRAPAQVGVGGFADGERSDEHAWVVTPSTVSSEWGLWHIPPREGGGPAGDGAVRIIDSLERQPEAMAASGGRVWMAFAGNGNRAGYGLLTAAVRRGAIEGTWYSGAGGRLGVAAFLATRGRIVSMAAGMHGPVALVEEPTGEFSLAWMERGRWTWASGPANVGKPTPQAVGVAADRRILLAAFADGGLSLWTATLPEAEPAGSALELLEPDALLEPGGAPAVEERAPVTLAWSVESATIEFSTEAGAEAARVVAGPVVVGGRVLVAVGTGETVRVFEVQLDVASEPGLLIYETQPGAVALLAAQRRGVVVRMGESPEATEGRAATRLLLEEFSLDSGRRLYSGPAVFDGPVSPSDIRIVLVLMVLVSASLLLFVVRTSKEATPFVAPRGCVLAPPMPRVLAAVADGFLAFLLGGELSRLLPEGWLAIRVGADAVDFAPLLLGLLLGLVAGAALESLTGRTPGKLIFGLLVCRCASPAEEGGAGGQPGPPERPGLGASLMRNAVKWLLPLVALAGMMSPLLRHRGDSISGLGVVGEMMPIEESGSSGQDPGAGDR